VGVVDLFPIFLFYNLLAFWPSFNILELFATFNKILPCLLMQDDLDEHVDVTNSRLQVCFPVFTLAVLNDWYQYGTHKGWNYGFLRAFKLC
jgi:hypothetical protein